MKYKYNDGGRKEAGYKGETNDCVVRAIAIATKLPYQHVYDTIKALGKTERVGKLKTGKSHPREGVYRTTWNKFLTNLGWQWVPIMKIGSGCTMHLNKDELPEGRLIVSVSKHMVAVIDGVIHDTFDCTRGGKRCVYGFWYLPEKKA